MSDDGSKDTIKMGPGFTAFANGVAAGAEANEKISHMTVGVERERLAFYWLSCGVSLATRVPNADDVEQLQFIAGAATRQPSSAPVSVTITSIDNAAFGHDEEEVDEDARRQEVVRLIRVAADRIDEGNEDGNLRDINGNTVGTFKYDPWSG